MPKLQLESPLDILSLNGIQDTGTGVQALSGATGLGLPPVSVQWLEGAGDGATYRGRRVLPRDIDLPLDVLGRDRGHLKQILARLSLMLADQCTLALIEDDGTRWTTEVVRVGGGEYVYGADSTGERDMQMVITLRAPDPYFTSSIVSSKTVGGDAGTAGFLSSLAGLPVASSQAIGEITLENPGEAPAYPLWEVYGPGRDFKAVSQSGETLLWEGALLAGEKLIVDTRKGTVVDASGANQYGLLAPAPRFWTIPPGTTSAEATLIDVTPASRIVCTWRARKWMVV
ncbi:phage tail family protein [Streptomyces smyrnaeus]|uniref:phage tail family protein n=1 Tax=Streptomyces smyrnaeus TaxID=1387713 RepID=UPI0033AFF0A7